MRQLMQERFTITARIEDMKMQNVSDFFMKVIFCSSQYLQNIVHHLNYRLFTSSWIHRVQE
jgi:hypothetical protein